MARNPILWYLVYGIIIPLAILVLNLYTGWGGILIVIGVILWMAFAMAMVAPRKTD